MKLTRREFLISPLVLLLGGNLFADTNLFSGLSDTKKREVLFDIADNMEYMFPVPMASESEREQALGVNKTSFDFGARGGKHRGIDVYGFGKDVVSFADGEVEIAGRNINSSDHGNLVVINHGEIRGYEVSSYYLHIGGVDGIKEGDKISMGDSFARVDCTGINYEKLNKKGDKVHILYTPNTSGCKRVAHLHFQIKVGDSYVNPNYFFPDYSKSSLPKLKRWRLSIKAGDINDNVSEFKRKEYLGSF